MYRLLVLGQLNELMKKWIYRVSLKKVCVGVYVHVHCTCMGECVRVCTCMGGVVYVCK